MDYSKVGFWLAIAALILMLPASMLANIVTPRFLGWWATTSKARSLARLEQLKKLLDNFDNFTEHDALAMCIRDFLFFALCAFVALCALVFFVVANNEYMAV